MMIQPMQPYNHFDELEQWFLSRSINVDVDDDDTDYTDTEKVMILITTFLTILITIFFDDFDCNFFLHGQKNAAPIIAIDKIVL